MLSFSFRTILKLFAKEGSLWLSENYITELCIYHHLSSSNKWDQAQTSSWASSTIWLKETAWIILCVRSRLICSLSHAAECVYPSKSSHLEASVMVHITHDCGQYAGIIGTHQFNDFKMAAKSPRPCISCLGNLDFYCICYNGGMINYYTFENYYFKKILKTKAMWRLSDSWAIVLYPTK